jgi:uncharacterized protein (DUF3820 family)
MMSYQKFPFGKYKGYNLADLPTTYIAYALEEFELPDDLSFDMKVILALRLNMTSVPDTNTLKVKAAYRELSKKFHPDKGGESESFRAITEFYKMLTDG